MTRLSARSVALVSCAFLSACLCAQTPTAPAGGTPPQAAQGQRQPRGPRPAPVNLKVLPKTMTGDEVIKLMRQYETDLGVNCEFCHAQNPETKRNDFASDANPEKETARAMIAMTMDLNDKYLADLPNRRYADPITCGTCHRGEKHPSVFVPPARPQGNGAPGMPAAATPPAGTSPH